MDREISRDSQMSYLQAIQKIPGDTAGEKLSWIGRLALHETNEDLEQLPSELLPLLRVEIAVKEKNHENITSAFKSENLTIINRALKASWFFDGSHKEIVDVAYFCERLFPYVSINTKTRIVITLAHRLFGKDPIFAQQMFTAVASIYDVQTAYPLFMACDETFAYETIVEKRLVLPVEIVRKIFRKNPNLVVRFLKLLKPVQKNATERIPYATECTPFAIGIDRYKSFLPKLIKRRVEDFVELYETHLPNIVLSNTCAELFLKKAKQHLIKKPLIYIRILPLKTINEHLMESIFPGMLPETISSFSTDTMLNYLKHYPRDKKYEFLRKSYKNKYNADLLDETRNVTPDLLRVLPVEERIKQARIKIEKEKTSSECPGNYETAWICYLSVNEAIPAIKEKINKTADEKDRLGFIKQMIYVCKINEDDDALYDTLVYFLNRHKNENGYIFEEMFETLLIIYDVPHLNKKQASLVMEIVRLFHIKNKFTPEDILLAMIHFRLIQGMPIEDLINIILENNTYINFNILTEYPQYERQCLVTFANLIQKKSFKNLKDKKKYNFKFVQAMYDFNTRWKKSSIKIEKMTIRDYPWLMDIILEMREEEDYPSSIEVLLQLHEPVLHRIWFPDSIMIVTSGAALALLKRDLSSILNNWKKYLEDSMKNHYCKRVQHFVRSMRWYQDLPVKFAECCMDYVYKKHRNKISSSMAILANLLHGDAVTKLIDPFMPTETKIDTSHPNAKCNYNIMQDLSLSIRLSNPPVPLDFIIKLCKEDYLSIALMTLMNVSRRTSLPKVISTAQKLISMRVSVRKHGIRLMSLASKQLYFHELMNFYQKAWSTEKHYSIRQVLFEEIQKLFFTDPRFETWSLYCQTVSTMNLDDEALLLKIMPLSISNEYVVKYLELWLKTIDNFQEMGLDIKKINGHIAQYLTMLLDVFNFLSEDFAENILRRFLFHVDTDISNKANSFAIWYILENISKDKQEARFKVFAELFRNAVTTYCDMPQSLEKLHFYPVNETVCSLINDFVTIYVSNYFRSNMSINPQIVDNMQILFSSVLLPIQDAWSYLLLVYAKKFQESSNMKSFGLKIGQNLPHLIDIFSSLLLSFMAEVLEYLLEIFKRYVKSSYEYEEFKLSIVEGLIEAGNTDSCFMAAIMLPSTIPLYRQSLPLEIMARYNQLIEKFQEMQEPAITTVLYNHFRNRKFKNC